MAESEHPSAADQTADTSEATHRPCCSAHGVDMTCAKYRRTHFVEVGACCPAYEAAMPSAADGPDTAAAAEPCAHTFDKVRACTTCGLIDHDGDACEDCICLGCYQHPGEDCRCTPPSADEPSAARATPTAEPAETFTCPACGCWTTSLVGSHYCTKFGHWITPCTGAAVCGAEFHIEGCYAEARATSGAAPSGERHEFAPASPGMSWSALLCIHTPRPGAGPCRLPADDPIHQPSAEETWNDPTCSSASASSASTAGPASVGAATDAAAPNPKSHVPADGVTDRLSAAGAPSPATGDVDIAKIRADMERNQYAEPEDTEALIVALEAARAERDEARTDAYAEIKRLNDIISAAEQQRDELRAEVERLQHLADQNEEAWEAAVALRDDAQAKLEEIRALPRYAGGTRRELMDAEQVVAILDRPAAEGP